jgi:hypothetical protein
MCHDSLFSRCSKDEIGILLRGETFSGQNSLNRNVRYCDEQLHAAGPQ